MSAALRRKLHAWELLHLREHAAAMEALVEAQAAEIADLKQRLAWAEDSADRWRDDILSMQDDGAQLGLLQTGRIILLQEPTNGH